MSNNVTPSIPFDRSLTVDQAHGDQGDAATAQTGDSDVRYSSAERTTEHTKATPDGGQQTTRVKRITAKLQLGWRFWVLFGVGATAVMVMHAERLIKVAASAYEFLKNLPIGAM